MVADGLVENWMKNHLVSDNSCTIVGLHCPNCFTKNDKVTMEMYFDNKLYMILIGENTIVN